MYRPAVVAKLTRGVAAAIKVGDARNIQMEACWFMEGGVRNLIRLFIASSHTMRSARTSSFLPLLYCIRTESSCFFAFATLLSSHVESPSHLLRYRSFVAIAARLALEKNAMLVAFLLLLA